MNKRSSLNKLPPEVLAWLDKALVERNFTGYRALVAELNDRGYAITKSALHRHGQAFEDRLGMIKAVTDQARALVEASPDDAGMVNEALTRVVQNKTFEVLWKLDTDAIDMNKVNLPALGKMVADLNRSSVAQKKWMLEARNRAQVVANKVAGLAKEKGLSKSTVDLIRREVLGIVPGISKAASTTTDANTGGADDGGK
jgi:hypothetical protein